jgi:hypothetical protein
MNFLRQPELFDKFIACNTALWSPNQLSYLLVAARESELMPSRTSIAEE